MYRKQPFRIAIVTFLCSLFLVSAFYTAHAGTVRIKERLDEVEFSRFTNDKGAVYKGMQLYKYHWAQFNVKPDASAPAAAQYVPLKGKGSKKDFIILYRKTEIGGVCARLGCEISIFEDTGDNKWRLVLTAFSHKIYVSNIKTDGYYNIYLSSSTRDLEEGDTGKTKFVWTGNKYVAERRLENKEK